MNSKKNETSSNMSQAIPAIIRIAVWIKYVGDLKSTSTCFCCELRSIMHSNYRCGHIISRSNGGLSTLNNLRPICGSCDKLIGTKNMGEFRIDLEVNGSLSIIEPLSKIKLIQIEHFFKDRAWRPRYDARLDKWRRYIAHVATNEEVKEIVRQGRMNAFLVKIVHSEPHFRFHFDPSDYTDLEGNLCPHCSETVKSISILESSVVVYHENPRHVFYTNDRDKYIELGKGQKCPECGKAIMKVEIEASEFYNPAVSIH